jgi:hypothetical protein
MLEEDPLRHTFYHESLVRMGVAAYAYRPPVRGENSFQDTGLISLSAPSLFVMRWQRILRPDNADPQVSAPLMIYRFAFDVMSGQVYIDARRDPECCTACWDIAILRELRHIYPHVLDGARNQTAAAMAKNLTLAAEFVIRESAQIPAAVDLPEFWLAFDPAVPPTFEGSAVLLANAAAALDKPIWEVSQAELRSFWDSQLLDVGGSLIGVRQEYLARQDKPYTVHPVDGSSPPEGPGWPDECRGLWYYRDGRWNPMAQRAYRALVRMDRVCGRLTRNPAFTCLRREKILPESLGFPEFKADPDGWVQLARENLQKTLESDPGLAERLLDQMKSHLGKQAAARGTDDDYAVALDRPDLALRLSHESRIGLVRYHGIPSTDALTFRHDGGYIDLFTVRPKWTCQVEPYVSRPAERRSGYGHQAHQPAR